MLANDKRNNKVLPDRCNVALNKSEKKRLLVPVISPRAANNGGNIGSPATKKNSLKVALCLK